MTQRILSYIEEVYGAVPEFLWEASPDSAAFRNPVTGKWFALFIGNLSMSKFGVDSEARCDVLNLKCDPLLSFNIVDGKGIFPAYHMSKEHWISVLLDGSVEEEHLRMLVDMSYTLVDKKNARYKRRNKTADNNKI